MHRVGISHRHHADHRKCRTLHLGLFDLQYRKSCISVILDQLGRCNRIINKCHADLRCIFNDPAFCKDQKFTVFISYDRAGSLPLTLIRIVKPVRIADHACDRNDRLIGKVADRIKLCLDLLIIINRKFFVLRLCLLRIFFTPCLRRRILCIVRL